MRTVTMMDAKTNLSKLVAEALAGEDIVIARGSTPAVRLVPVVPVGRRSFGAFAGQIAFDPRFDDPLPVDELARWT